MGALDQEEQDLLASFERGELQSVASKGKLARLRAAARATGLKDCRVNIRLSAGDLNDLRVRALEEGVTCQTLVASVPHKYVSGRLTEIPFDGPGAGSKEDLASGT